MLFSSSELPPSRDEAGWSHQDWAAGWYSGTSPRSSIKIPHYCSPRTNSWHPRSCSRHTKLFHSLTFNWDVKNLKVTSQQWRDKSTLSHVALSLRGGVYDVTTNLDPSISLFLCPHLAETEAGDKSQHARDSHPWTEGTEVSMSKLRGQLLYESAQCLPLILVTGAV